MTGMAVPLISGTTVTVQTTAANGMLINVPARVCLPGQVLSDLPPTPIWVYDPSTGRVMQTLTRRVIGLTDVLLCVFTGIICFLCCPCAHDTDHYTPDGRYVGKSKVTI
ncbi:unnamed protein product [Vitrella brassicaformis CCMP3155]|uniref:Uncharacterized protein n=2 Tax=Vitrella brassicaformis TaxID=1169539 RepID=A0A0G4H5S2_VITBC|nr:unnamed protein product [Vitrella brassicaformis CCMP3155]|eukprot:CEM39188.1 unnamed protein product [Vitrella brassicaformis CCMP3155]